MTDSKTLKLLVVEDNLEDEQLLCEALIEIEENRQWCTWRTASIVHVEELADALQALRQESFDAVLLNLSLPDTPALLDTFLEVNACACGIPIVVLADEEDENLANRLLREGAQDVLLKSELECAPLARSLRYAVERQRRISAAAAAPFSDELTGTLTRQAFLAIGERCLQLGQHSRSSLPLLFASLEISELTEKNSEHRDQRELLLIRAGETLLRRFESPSLIGRVARCRFALLIAGLTQTTIRGLLHRAATEIEEFGFDQCHPVMARFSVGEIHAGDTLDDLLQTDSEDSFARSQHAMKTVMLAD